MNNNVKPNDKEMLEDILSSLKGICDLLMHGNIESSDENVNATFNNSLFETLKLQNDTFNAMVDYNFYQIEAIDTQKINQTKMKLQSNQ